MGLSLNGGGTAITEGTEKAELQNATFPWVFTGKTSPWESPTEETGIEECCKKYLPLVKEDWVREHLVVKT